jgi:hypothetical protein
MPRTDLRKIIANFITLIVLVICFSLISDLRLFELGTAMGQSQKKTITHAHWKNQPVKFRIKAAGKPLSLKATSENEEEIDIDGDDDWLKGLGVHLKNTSNKNIIYINFHLAFPETDISGLSMSHSMRFGRYPEKPNVGSNDKVLKPGEEIEIALTDKEHADLYDLLKSRNFHQVNSLRVVLQSVIFEDDTQFYGGNLMKRDPFNSALWVNAGEYINQQ